MTPCPPTPAQGVAERAEASAQSARQSREHGRRKPPALHSSRRPRRNPPTLPFVAAAVAGCRASLPRCGRAPALDCSPPPSPCRRHGPRQGTSARQSRRQSTAGGWLVLTGCNARIPSCILQCIVTSTVNSQVQPSRWCIRATRACTRWVQCSERRPHSVGWWCTTAPHRHRRVVLHDVQRPVQ